MSKINCWEFTKCGREPGGAKATQLGLCPVVAKVDVDGVNGGRNGGRACWAISGTFCGEKVQGTFASKLGDCKKCDFYKLVQKEEGDNLASTRQIRAAVTSERVRRRLGENFKNHLHQK